MNIYDNVKGSPIRSHRSYAGPTLGWIEVPIFQDKILTGLDLPTYRIQPWDSVLLLRLGLGGNLTILLPPSKRWYNKDYGSFSIYIKDIFGIINPTTNAIFIEVDPEGGPSEDIDGIDTYTMISPYASTMLRPRSDLRGWYSL
jgi:hypothetical protein